MADDEKNDVAMAEDEEEHIDIAPPPSLNDSENEAEEENDEEEEVKDIVVTDPPKKKRAKAQPGISILRAERSRLTRNLENLRKKRAIKCAGSVKRPTTTVVGLLMDSLIQYYENAIAKYDELYDRYM